MVFELKGIIGLIFWNACIIGTFITVNYLKKYQLNTWKKLFHHLVK